MKKYLKLRAYGLSAQRQTCHAKINNSIFPDQSRNLKKTIFVTKIIFILLATVFSNAVAANSTVHTAFVADNIQGTISTADGMPLSGATITVKGTSTHVISGKDGSFSITAKIGSTLIITYVGYSTKEVSVNGTNLKITLTEQANLMDEVVAIGYGSAKKRNTTGAISSIKATDVVLSTNSNILQSIAGKTPGLQAIQPSGQPGANVTVQLRGNPSFASSGVLYVLDGVIVNDASSDPGTPTRYGNGGVDRSPLNFLNPNDIESIDFIKDASAASIYGARAGGGVILITTKKGTLGKAKIEYNGTYATQKTKNQFDVFGTKEYMEYRNQMIYEGWLNTNKIAPYGTVDPAAATTVYVPRYTQSQIDNAEEQNAMDAIMRNGLTVQHNISVAGTSGKTRYFVSGNFFDADGVIKVSSYKRLGGRLNLSHQLSDKLRFGMSATYTQAKGNNATTNKSQFENAGIIMSAIYHPPTVPLQNADGSYPLNPDYAAAPNPLSFLTVTDFNDEKRLIGNVYGEWDIVKGLTYKAAASYDQSSNNRDLYQPKTFLYGARSNGFASIGTNNSQNSSFEHTLVYKKLFNNSHALDVLAGYSYQKLVGNGFSTSASDFLTDNFKENSLQSGTVRGQSYSNKNELIWASYFSRLIYTYNNRYTLSASIRRDGASRFAKNKKYGIFPSISAGWVASDESFLRNNKYINFLKMSLAYGGTGNSNISSSAFSFYNPGRNYQFGNTENIGVYFSQLANPDLTWEDVREINFHLDLQAFKSRVNVSLDLFNKTINGLLDNVPLTTDFIVSSVTVNSGKTRSKGWEIGLNTNNIVSKRNEGFSWSTNINFSKYKNTWIKKSEASLKVMAKYVDPYRAGSFDDIYGIQSAGIYKGGPKPAAQPNLSPGGIILKDVNGYGTNGLLTGVPDGKIDAADNVVIASNQPDFNFGITNTFKYKNFDFTVFMYGLKRKQLNSDLVNAWSYNINNGWNKLRFIRDNGWSSSNQDANYPNQMGAGVAGDFWYEDASFIRVRDIMLGYTLPKKLMDKQQIVKDIRLTLNIQNAFLFTNYGGLDPELNGYVSYPNPRSVIFGLNASF